MDGWIDGWLFEQTIIIKLPIALLLASMQTCLNDNKTCIVRSIKRPFIRNLWKISVFLKSKCGGECFKKVS